MPRSAAACDPRDELSTAVASHSLCQRYQRPLSEKERSRAGFSRLPLPLAPPPLRPRRGESQAR